MISKKTFLISALLILLCLAACKENAVKPGAEINITDPTNNVKNQKTSIQMASRPDLLLKVQMISWLKN